jgi:hypothetical protein
MLNLGRSMTRAAFFGLCALSVAMACRSDSPLHTEPVGPLQHDSVVTPVSTFAGAPLTGKWIAPPAAGFIDLTIEVTEGSGGKLSGVWSATHSWCTCVVSGRLSEEAAPIVHAFASSRVGAAVNLFLTADSGPFVLHNAWGTFVGKMLDANHMSGELFYSDGSGYFGDDGIEETVVISR